MSDNNFNTNEQGIPSVLGNKTKKSNKAGYLLLGAALALGLGLAYASTSDNKTPVTADNNDESRNLTSSKVLTTTKLPSREERMAAEQEEKRLKAEEEKKAKSDLPYALPDVQVADNSNMFGEKVMTLDEKKFKAPMMGKIQTSTDGVGASAYEGRANGNELPIINMGEKEQTPTHLRKDLASQLESVSTPQAYASKMSDRSLTLAKGTMIECILETRVDTSVPAMTSCVIPRDIYSHNGRVLLLERGTRAVGEYQGSVQNGLERIFMLWTELRTPNGIVIPIGSPSTDALGAGGVGGYVDHHWWKRFGNAIMFSLVADGFDYAIATQQSKNVNSNVTYTNTDNGVSEMIKAAMQQSGNIPPTLIKNQGERVGIFVARDLSFASVYELNKVGR